MNIIEYGREKMVFNFTDGYEDYAVFPMHYVRVTQSWNQGNHRQHWDGANYKDYPIDIGGMDSGRDFLYATVDLKVLAISGIGSSSVSNKLFLTSVNKVNTPKWGKVQIFLTAVHFEDSDISKYDIKVGKVFKRGEIICAEGKETATANHLHVTCGIGTATKSIKNNNGKYVTSGDCKKPEEIFFIDNSFNNVMSRGNLNWMELPKIEKVPTIGTPVIRNVYVDQIEVITSTLNVRNKASVNGIRLGYATVGIYEIISTAEADGYVWYEIASNEWIAGNEGIWTKFYAGINNVPVIDNGDIMSGVDIIKDNVQAESSIGKTKISLLQKIKAFIKKFLRLG